MKKNLLAFSIAALFVTGVAQAESTTNVQVVFSGSVAESVCAISINNGNPVQLGTVSAKHGQRGIMMDVPFVFSDCDVGAVSKTFDLKVLTANTGAVTNGEVPTSVQGAIVKLYKDATGSALDDVNLVAKDMPFEKDIALVPLFARLETVTDTKTEVKTGSVQPVVTFEVTVK